MDWLGYLLSRFPNPSSYMSQVWSKSTVPSTRCWITVAARSAKANNFRKDVKRFLKENLISFCVGGLFFSSRNESLNWSCLDLLFRTMCKASGCKENYSYYRWLKCVFSLTRADLAVHVEWLGLVGFDGVNSTLPLASIKHFAAVCWKICNKPHRTAQKRELSSSRNHFFVFWLTVCVRARVGWVTSQIFEKVWSFLVWLCSFLGSVLKRVVADL